MNIDREFEQVTEYWSPRVVADANGQLVKIAKIKGEFVWHSHAEEDEFFLVRKGTFIIRYRHGRRSRSGTATSTSCGAAWST
jgi:mannose-6-phosphate isomerase-like protein (cupin superfamily)